MAAHIGVDSTFGVTPPGTTTITRATRQNRVETVKKTGASGEFVKYRAGKVKTQTVTLEGDGLAPHGSVTAADGVTPSTLKLMESRQREVNGPDGAGFTARYEAKIAFEDSDSSEAAGSAPDLSTIEIVGATYTATESLESSVSVQGVDKNSADATPGFRGAVGKTGSFSLSGWGDLPVALGTGGAGVDRLTGGVLICEEAEETENASDCNGWRASGGWCPSAS